MPSRYATSFGLPAGSPIYYDMEGYALGERIVHEGGAVVRLRRGSSELRAHGFVAGVYGSAASTIRDIAALGPALPDAGWIANWNGVESVFGDPYVSDSVWPNHQRVHQYKGGHKETWGGVTINIDSTSSTACASAAPRSASAASAGSRRQDRSAPATGRRRRPGPTVRSRRPRS